ncbi:MAG: hypothetical protein J5I90_13180 [Caldilineales bacterium]|nr:hypothetical protein [Caldilineales bacterium]
MAGWLARMIHRIARRIAPAEGWLAFLALMVAALVLALMLDDARWIRSAPSMAAVVFLSVITGVALARFVRKAWLAALFAIVAGLLVSVMTAAAAWPPLRVLIASLFYWLSAMRGARPESAVIAPGVWIGERLARWQQVMEGRVQASLSEHGITGSELTILLLLLLVWFAGVWAGWATLRRRNALEALAPMGILLASSIFFAGEGQPWLLFFMSALLLLAVSLQSFSLRNEWEARNVDYSPEIRFDFYLYGGIVLMAALALMPLVPNVRVRPVSRAFWNMVDWPFEEVARNAENRPFVDEGLPGEPAATGIATGESMPRSHLLGSGPELAERPVMRVQLHEDDLLALGSSFNPRWRGLTYSVYNGRGWVNPDRVEIERLGSGEVWQRQMPASRRSLTQVFDFIDDTPFWLYAAGDAMSADRPYRAYLRSPDDAIGLEAHAADYVAVSLVPAAGESQLENAGSDYPAEFDNSLALPDSVPERVHALATEIAGDASSDFAAAMRIESYLRQIPYNLEIAAPPPGVDAVDYFLFENRQGYCDYYASAMVVLARSLGIPARLAVGYASGALDAATGQFLVTEADAHSWPELYFPEYGWIPFEPTASQPASEFIEQPAFVASTVPDQGDFATELAGLRRARLLKIARTITLPLVVALLVIVAYLSWRRERRLRRNADNPWQLAYLRLESWGERFGIPTRPSYTPPEYAGHWRAWLQQSPAASGLSDAAARAIDELTDDVQRRAYAPANARPADKTARAAWSRLSRILWRLRLANVRLSPRARKRRGL